MMMNDNKLIKMAEYNEIVVRLIYENKISSYVKLLFISLAVYNMQNFTLSFEERNIDDMLYSSINRGINNGDEDLKIIISCIDILVKAQYISIIDNRVLIRKTIEYEKQNKILGHKYFVKIINKIEKIQDVSFIKGVIDNV